MLDDYANMARAALALHEAGAGDDTLDHARAWLADLDAQFWDGAAHGYCSTADDAPALIARTKTILDSALPAGNAVALGGLEQVTEQTTNTRIEALRRQALVAEQAEAWQTASDRYAEVLSLDGNIRFARAGRTRAAEQARAALALSNIAAAPEKLSSKTLFAEAEALLAQAMNLNPRGPNLAALLVRTQRLIEAYRHPVAVTLLSDNETQVTLSTVGQLGSFERKQVNLRPGAYTLIGSRDGCRDVRQQIVVRADMRPIEIRCVERL